MEVYTIESEAYKAQQESLNLLRKLFLDTVEELKEAKDNKWMSVAEVMQFTGFSRQWLMMRKHDIGYFQDGKDLRFWKPDLIKFMELRSVKPKINKTLLKLQRS
jgi:hypothetical protein